MDSTFFQPLFDWLSAHPYWSGVAVFVIAMSESLAVVGLVVPGVVLMFAIGALIAAGVLEFWPVYAWAVAGAITGDGVSFWLGHHFRDRIAELWPFSKHPKMLAHGMSFFRQHGGKSVLFGRFVGPVRPVIPMVAGMLGMSRNRFLAINVTSALAWAPAYLVPGIVFGASLELAAEVATRLALLIVILVVTLWLVSWLVRRGFALLQPHAAAIVDGLWQRTAGRRWLGQLSAAVADPDHPEARGLFILALMIILGAWGFMAVLTDVLVTTPGTGLDQVVNELARSLRTPWADTMMAYVTQLGGHRFILYIGIAVFGWLCLQRKFFAAWHWLAAVAFGMVASEILKNVLEIPRPGGLQHVPGSYAFPSGHTLQVTTSYGFLAVLVATGIRTQLRWIPYLLAGLLIALMAMSRVYLGLHWLSDVAGGITLGVVWTCLLGIAYRRHSDSQSQWSATSLLSGILLVMVVYATAFSLHKTDPSRYALATEHRQLRAGDWWASAWQQLPQRRQDLARQVRQALNIQWQGSLAGIESVLTSAGWQPAIVLELDTVLTLLNPEATLAELPVLPQVHRGRHPALTLTRPIDATHQITLRLWSSGVTLTPAGKPVWLGNISVQSPADIAGLVRYARTGRNTAAALADLRAQLAASGTDMALHDSGEVSVLLLRH